MECRQRTAWPFKARSQWDTSTTGLSGFESLKVPFQVLPSNGCKGSRWGFSGSLSAPAKLNIALPQAIRTMILVIGGVVCVVTRPSCQMPCELYWKNFTSIGGVDKIRILEPVAQISRRVQPREGYEIIDKVGLINQRIDAAVGPECAGK